MKRSPKFFAVAILLFLLAACGGDAEEATAVPTEAPASATATTAPAANPTAAPVEPTAAAVEATEAPAEPTAAPQAEQAAAPSGDAQEAVLNALRLQLTGGPYRAISTVAAEGTTTEMTAEVIPPSTMHLVIVAEGGNTEMIWTGEKLWMKSGETPWMEMPGGDMIQGMIDSVLTDVENSMITNVQLIGPESVEGEAATAYSYESSVGEGDEMITSTNKLWISDVTGLPIKLESNSQAMGITSHTVQIIEYDESITTNHPFNKPHTVNHLLQEE